MNIALNGCGRVGKALLQFWEKQAADVQVVYIRRSNSQWRVDQGIDSSELQRFIEQDYFPGDMPEELDQFLSECPIDIWIELTPTDLDKASAVHERLLQVLERRIPIIIANKAPVVYDYMALKRAADANQVGIGLSAVMGASLPSFALGHYGAMGANIESMAGILNGTTNFLLDQMEQGKSFESALDLAIQRGIAETDWAYDVDGIDSAVKMTILASVIMNQNVALDMQNVTGIRKLSSERIAELKTQQKRYKLVARYTSGVVRVAPEVVSINDIFYHVGGANKILHLKTRELSEMSVIGGKSGLPEVAASMHRDLLWLQENYRFVR